MVDAPARATDTDPPGKPTAPVTRSFIGTRSLNDEYRCGGSCRLWTHEVAKLSLNLAPAGRATASDAGQREVTYQAVTGEQREITSWSHHWTGAWSSGPSGYSVGLTLATSTCDRALAGGASEPCPVTKEMALRCVDVRIDVNEHASYLAVECNTKSATIEGMTPMPWLLGAGRELQVRDEAGERYVMNPAKQPGAHHPNPADSRTKPGDGPTRSTREKPRE